MTEEQINNAVELFSELPVTTQDGIIALMQYLLSEQEETPAVQAKDV